MNATATTAAPTAAPKIEAAYAVILLGHIGASATPMQKLRRQHFDKPALTELAASIKALGVLQPILVRPDPKVTSGGYYELVAGERRYLAAKIAGITTIPATIRQLTDLEVIEMQVVENNQREGLHELIEAEGFDQLRKEHNLTAEDIADKVGRSRRYVFNRLKLCDLCPEARAAFYDDRIGGTVAFEIARIGHHDTQRECLRALLHGAGKDEQPTARYAKDHIRRTYMLMLNQAPFSTTDATLCPKAGGCGPCPKRTGNQKELFDDVKSADVCTDPKCYADKVEAHNKRRREAAEKAGRTVITGKAAKEMFPHQHVSRPSGAVLPADKCYNDPKYRTYREILGKDAPPLVLVENPHKNELVEVWPETLIKKVLAEKLPKRKTPAHGNTGSSHMGNSHKSDYAALGVLQQRTVVAVFHLVRAKHPGKLGRNELLNLAERLHENLSTDGPHVTQWKLPTTTHYAQLKKILAFTDKDLLRFIVDALIIDAIEGCLFYNNIRISPTLTAICKPLRIDPKKVQKSVADSLKKAKADKAKPATAPAAAKKKTAPAKKKTVAKK